MKAVTAPTPTSPDDREALSDLVRLLARLAAAEYVRARSGATDAAHAALPCGGDATYDGTPERP